MAKTKATGGTHLGRDPRPKYLGVKVYAGQSVKVGSVLVRQRGTSILAGKNVKVGADNTLYATNEGITVYRQIRKRCFNGGQRRAKIVEVLPFKVQN